MLSVIEQSVPEVDPVDLSVAHTSFNKLPPCSFRCITSPKIHELRTRYEAQHASAMLASGTDQNV